MSYKKIFLLGFIIVILIAIPFSIYIAQKRQSLKSKADASTTLSFDPTSATVEIGDTVSLDIYLDPKTGTTGYLPNQVSFAKFTIKYDSLKFATSSGSLTVNTDISNTLTTLVEGPTYEPGKVSISLSIGADPTKVVTTKTKIATLQLRAVDAITPTAENITFDSDPYTQVLSIASSDETSENVLSTTVPATVTVSSGTVVPTPTGITTTLAPTPTGTSTSSGIAPVCTSLNVDRSTEGTAPYSLTFTATGNDSDSTIKEASFNFGDGPIHAVTSGGGIGTRSLNAQISHTYENAGTYTAFVTIIDSNNNSSSQQSSCTKTINVENQQGGSDSGSGGTPDSGSNIQPLPTQIVLPPTGPGDKIIGIGVIGIMFTLIGGVLLILL
jgi:hypothetical protein